MARDDDRVFRHEKFAGLRNNVSADGFGLGDLEVALNVDIDDELAILRRKGFSCPILSGPLHSLWSNGTACFVVSGSDLLQVLPDVSTTIVRTGLTPDLPMSYAALGARVYYSNGLETGVIDDGSSRSWGLPVPPTPAATATGGSLRPGRYQFVVVNVRGDAQESGAGRAGLINLPTGGGFVVSLPDPGDPDVMLQRVYTTKPDGEDFYMYGDFAGSAALVNSPALGTVRLSTQFLAPPPAGHHLAYYNGRTFVARGSIVYPSEPYALELFDLRRAIPLTSPVTLLAPVKGGLFVGTATETAFWAGDGPENFDYRQVANYGVIARTLAIGSADQLDDGQQRGRAAFWASTQGLCVGLDGGDMRNLTQTRFAYPTTARGAGIVRRFRGINQYLAVLEGAETAGNTESS